MHTFSPNLGTDPVVISLRGVECMKDDPSAVDVLYAKVCLTDGTNRLMHPNPCYAEGCELLLVRICQSCDLLVGYIAITVHEL